MTVWTTARRAVGRRLPGRGRRQRTAVVVPVPDIESRLTDWRMAHGLPPDDAPAHVTVLYPFVAAAAVDTALCDGLARLAAATPAFDFHLTCVARFPGVLYLAPEPAAPFVALTEAVTARWPDHPPYEGAFDAIVPHLTIATGEEPAGLAVRVAAQLPVRATAREVMLLAQDTRGRWRPRATFPLGG